MILVRAATRADYDALCMVIQEIDAFHADAIPHFFQHFDGPARSWTWFMDALDNPDSILIVAEQDGKIVGYLWGLVRTSADMPMIVPRRWLVVDNLAVAATHRGQGVGRALMEHAHEWARGQGMTEVELTVWEFNTGAIAFYEALGYTTIVRRLWKGLE
jgi:ribosomal protein S18 acetylase RimI-like enzyme